MRCMCITEVLVCPLKVAGGDLHYTRHDMSHVLNITSNIVLYQVQAIAARNSTRFRRIEPAASASSIDD